MKYRQGFISNSSSTSFCCLGIEVKQPKDFDEWDWTNQDDWRDSKIYIDDEIEYITTNNSSKLWDEDHNYIAKYSLEELKQKFEQLAKDNNVDISEVKLYVGERQC